MMYVGNKLPMRLDSSLVGFVFFCAGSMFSNYLKGVRGCSIKKKMLLVMAAFIILSLSAYFNLNLRQRQGLSINAMYYGQTPFLFILSGLSGTAVLLLLSSFLSEIKYKTILTISNGTIVVLGFHWAIYKLVFSWWLSSQNIFIAMVVALADLMICYCLILAFSRYLPAVLGDRKLN